MGCLSNLSGALNNIPVVDGDTLTLVDVGSHRGSITGSASFDDMRERFGGTFARHVRHVVITHAHIDHFGWVGHSPEKPGPVSGSTIVIAC